MKKIIFIISAIVLVFVDSCRKPYEYIEPKITEISDWSNGTWATISGKVNFLGEKYMFVDVGKQPDLSDAHRYEMQQSGDYEFTVGISDLDFGSKYYYRVEAGNTNFSMVSEVKHFKLTEATLLYGDGYRKSCWGYVNNNNENEYLGLEWAVRFTPTMLSAFDGSSITKVRVNVGTSASYKLKIYKDGSYSPSTLIKTLDFNGSNGWNEISFSPIVLDIGSPLWISVYTYQKKGSYFASTSNGINNSNSRWVKTDSGTWMDGKDWASDHSDLCWMIQAFITLDTKGEEGLEMELPLLPVEQENEIIAESLCLDVVCKE